MTDATNAGEICLETDRLILRPWEDRDRQGMAAIHGNPEVRRFFPRILSPEEVDADIDNSLQKSVSDGFHIQAAELKGTGELIGLIGINLIPEVIRQAIPSRPAVEIGWVLADRFWGRGLAPEGAAAWLDYAWSIGLHEVIATTALQNVPSQRVMEKLGMRRDPADDYERPTVPEGNPLRPHVVYRIGNPRPLPKASAVSGDTQ
jgi:RimJ/RimL family protein N-acetyltransferase